MSGIGVSYEYFVERGRTTDWTKLGAYMSVDLADVLERTRRLKRKLCAPPYSFDTDFVFSGDFLEPDHIAALRSEVSRLVAIPCSIQCLDEMDSIVAALRANPTRPTDQELCRRYAQNEIEARTVRHITGWSPVDLYNKCTEFGYKTPAFDD